MVMGGSGEYLVVGNEKTKICNLIVMRILLIKLIRGGELIEKSTLHCGITTTKKMKTITSPSA
jgi:hypothetical protein